MRALASTRLALNHLRTRIPRTIACTTLTKVCIRRICTVRCGQRNAWSLPCQHGRCGSDVMDRLARQKTSLCGVRCASFGDGRKPRIHTLDIQSGPECRNIALEILPVGYLLGSKAGISFLTSAKRLAALENLSFVSFLICATLIV